jgi:hypothetical protein
MSIYGCLNNSDSDGGDGEDARKKIAGFFGYLLQIVYQVILVFSCCEHPSWK